jgi:hypothetical protein
MARDHGHSNANQMVSAVLDLIAKINSKKGEPDGIPT